jgi:hypothetical protein
MHEFSGFFNGLLKVALNFLSFIPIIGTTAVGPLPMAGRGRSICPMGLTIGVNLKRRRSALALANVLACLVAMGCGAADMGCGGADYRATSAPVPALLPAPARATNYSTNFSLTENPISEGGTWINGKAVGLDWNNAQSVPGKAYASAIAMGYNDNIAVLNTTFAANQYVQGIVYRSSGYSPGVSHEIELLLRFRITANNARGYEVLWAHDGKIAIVRWNGPLGNYTPLLEGPNVGAAVDGDVLRADILGSVIKVYKNGSLVATGPSDMVWTDGQPGMGFWPKLGATLESYGWKAFQAGGCKSSTLEGSAHR